MILPKHSSIDPRQTPVHSREKIPAAAAGIFPWSLLTYGLLIIACMVVYGRSLNFGITGFDDENVIHVLSSRQYRLIDVFSFNTFIHEKDNGVGFYRPLGTASFILNSALSGASVRACHLIDIILHALVVCCLLRLLFLLGFDRRLSFFVALVYAVHPLFEHAVIWIPARADLMIGLFGLLAFIYLVKFRISGGYRFLLMHAAAFLCATLSKENGLMLPPLFAAYLLLSDRKKALTLRNLNLTVLWIAIVAGYFILRGPRPSMGGVVARGMFGFGPLMGSLRALPEMLGYLAVPWDIPVLPGFTLRATLIGLLAALGVAVALGVQRRLGKPMVILGVFWYVFLSIPGLMYRHEFGSHAYDFLNHRSYFPMVGVFIILAEAVPVGWLKAQRKPFTIIASAAAVVLGLLAWRQCGYFADPAAFFGQAIRTNPNSSVAWYNRGRIRHLGGNYADALQDYNRALNLYPGYLDALSNRGNVRGMLGDNAGAIADLTKSIALNSTDAHSYCDRGTWEESAGDTAGALADYNHAIRLNPRFPEAFANRGAFFAGRGDLARAASDFRSAINLDPLLSAVMIDLGRIYLQSGDTAGACRQWQCAARLGSSPALEMKQEYCR